MMFDLLCMLVTIAAPFVQTATPAPIPEPPAVVVTSAPEPAPITSPLRVVVLHVPKATLRVEVANNDPERARGLMDRYVLALHTGMVFVFDADAPVGFWMKDTRIPLDMIFVSKSGVVRSVAAWVKTVPVDMPDDRIPVEHGTAKYVIELPAGEAAKDGIKAGVTIRGISAAH